MFHPKIQLLSQAGLFNPRMAQKNFFRNNINYELDDPESPFSFSENTKIFLMSLDNLSYLKLYLNFDKYLTNDEWYIFKTTLMNDIALKLRMTSIIVYQHIIINPDLLILLMLDKEYINFIPSLYIKTLLNTDPEFRRQIANYPDLVEFVTNLDRPQLYVWGDLMPFPYLPEEDDDEIAHAAQSMNQLNI